MFATFNGTWDWTAVGTLALAVVTLALAVATFWMVKLTRRALTQNRDEIALSRREVEEAHRPVVVPLADFRVIEFVGPEGRAVLPAVPAVEEGRLFVPVENVGTGPALDLEAAVELLNSAGGWSGAAGGEQPGAAMALRSSSRILMEARIHGLTGITGFRLTLSYRDVAGKKWITRAKYVPDRDRYEDLAMMTVDQGALWDAPRPKPSPENN
jgi:hypothetical protein